MGISFIVINHTPFTYQDNNHKIDGDNKTLNVYVGHDDKLS